MPIIKEKGLNVQSNSFSMSNLENFDLVIDDAEIAMTALKNRRSRRIQSKLMFHDTADLALLAQQCFLVVRLSQDSTPLLINVLNYLVIIGMIVTICFKVLYRHLLHSERACARYAYISFTIFHATFGCMTQFLSMAISPTEGNLSLEDKNGTIVASASFLTNATTSP